MSVDPRDKIIDDLLKKTPKGPSTGIDEPVDLTRDHYGYKKEVLFDLQIHSYIESTHYVRGRFFSGISASELGRRKATVTRRAKRIWHRVERAVREVVSEGPKGIYKVMESRWSYTGAIGYVHANNKEEAQKMADMFFGYVMSTKYSSKPYVEIVQRGGPENLMSYNQKILEKLVSTISGLEKDIEFKTKNLQTLKARLDVIKALQEGQTKKKSS